MTKKLPRVEEVNNGLYLAGQAVPGQQQFVQKKSSKANRLLERKKHLDASSRLNHARIKLQDIRPISVLSQIIDVKKDKNCYHSFREMKNGFIRGLQGQGQALQGLLNVEIGYFCALMVFLHYLHFSGFLAPCALKWFSCTSMVFHA